jgi:uncharacterized alkaline shock family protein YloU
MCGIGYNEFAAVPFEFFEIIAYKGRGHKSYLHLGRSSKNNMANQNGVHISQNVVAVIAGLAASNVNGISGMSGGIGKGWVRVGGKNWNKGVSITMTEDVTVVDLRVVVQFGIAIHDVCHHLQQEVRRAIEEMTGLHVAAVNVKVDGVDIKRTHPDEEHSLESGIG